MQFWTLDEIERQVRAEHEVGEELAPGVTITRRRILQAGLAGLASVAVAGCAASAPGKRASAAGGTAEAPLTLDQLVARLRPEAQQLIASDRPDEEAYLAHAAELLASYDTEEPWSLREPGDRGFSMNTMAWMPPVLVFDIRMLPGATIPLHDHRHYNGIVVCRKGSVRCRNFDIVPPDGQTLDVAAGEVPPTGEDFLIRQTRDAVIEPGQHGTLTRDRDNIHHVVAGADGCELTDVFTYFRREARSYNLDWDDQPTESGGDTYTVSWKA